MVISGGSIFSNRASSFGFFTEVVVGVVGVISVGSVVVVVVDAVVVVGAAPVFRATLASAFAARDSALAARESAFAVALVVRASALAACFVACAPPFGDSALTFV